MPVRIINTETNELTDVSSSEVARKILGQGFDFPSNDKVYLRNRSGEISRVSGSEARELMFKGANYLSDSEAFKLLEKQEYGDSSLAAAALGIADYSTFGAVPYVTRLLSDDLADKYAKIQKYNPGVYHGAGIGSAVIQAILSGGASAFAQSAKATAAGARLGTKETLKRVAIGAPGTSALKTVAGAAPGLASRAGIATQKAVSSLVGKGTSKAIPGLKGKSLNDVAPFTADLMKGTVGGAAAALVEGGLYSAGQGLSEAALANEDAVEAMVNRMGSDAILNSALGAGFSGGLPLLGRIATATTGSLGSVYQLAANSKISKATTDSLAKIAVTMQKQGASASEIREAQLMFSLGKDGQKARRDAKRLTGHLKDIASSMTKTLDESFLIEDILQQADRRGISKEFISKMLGGSEHASILETLKRFKMLSDTAVEQAHFLKRQFPIRNGAATKELREAWTTRSQQMSGIFEPNIGKATGIKESKTINPAGWVNLLSNIKIEGRDGLAQAIKSRMGNRGPTLVEIQSSLRVHASKGDVEAFINLLEQMGATGIYSKRLSTAAFKRAEDINNIYHTKFKDFGGLKGLTAGNASEEAMNTVEASAKGFMNDQELFGELAMWNNQFRRKRKDYAELHKQFQDGFFAKEGLETFADEAKVLAWLKSLNRTNINSKTGIMERHHSLGAEVLSELLSSHNFDRKLKPAFTKKLMEYIGKEFKPGETSIRPYYSEILKRVKKSQKNTQRLKRFLTEDLESAMRWSQVQGQTHNANEYFFRRMTPFLPFAYLYSLPLGAAVNVAEAVVDPTSAAGRLYFMEHMVQSGQKQAKDLVNNYMKQLATGGKDKIPKRPIARSFVLPMTAYRDPEGLKKEIARDKKRKDLLEEFRSEAIQKEQFDETKQLLTFLATDATSMEQFLDAATSPFGDETSDIRPIMKQVLRKRIMYAYRNIPTAGISSVFDEDPFPSSLQMAKFARILEALEDPYTAIGNGLADNTLTREVIDAVKETSPQFYNEFRSEVMQALSDPDVNKNLTRPDKLALGQLFDIPAVNASTMSRLMGNFSQEQRGAGRPPSFKPMKNATNTGEIMSSIVEG
mgnify:CR=1 FL=1|tara:strand:- start:825 stop:4079 length:3255 start_codon:yes stop_codon:yes gene_type:complete